MKWLNEIICIDVLKGLKQLPDNSIDCMITSPPYWGKRDYNTEGQLGLEKTPKEYVQKMAEIFREVRRVLKKEGTCWLNLGDTYSGSCGNTSDVVETLRGKEKTDASRPSGIPVTAKIEGLKPKILKFLKNLLASSK